MFIILFCIFTVVNTVSQILHIIILLPFSVTLVNQ